MNSKILIQAIRINQPLLVKKLLDKGHKNNDALRVASYSGHADIVQILLSTGHKDNHALWVASSNGHADIVQMLKEAGMK